MNDRFKFRYFNKGSKRMYYGQGFYIQKLGNDPCNIIFFDNEEHSHLQWKPDVIPMQCTGLKDKNGKLIYEGDIIAFINPYENNKILAIPVKWEYSPFLTGFSLTKDFARDVEVIGNIYENKELLNE